MKNMKKTVAVVVVMGALFSTNVMAAGTTSDLDKQIDQLTKQTQELNAINKKITQIPSVDPRVQEQLNALNDKVNKVDQKHNTQKNILNEKIVKSERQQDAVDKTINEKIAKAEKKNAEQDASLSKLGKAVENLSGTLTELLNALKKIFA